MYTNVDPNPLTFPKWQNHELIIIALQQCRFFTK